MMKSSLLFVATGQWMAMSTHAWVLPNKSSSTSTAKTSGSRQDFLQHVGAALVGTGLVVMGGPAASPLPANAAEEFDPKTFNHQYSDPKHPNCKRIVVVKADGVAAVSGTDGTPGCPEDGSGNIWRLVGDVQGKNILVDFSPKVRNLLYFG